MVHWRNAKEVLYSNSPFLLKERETEKQASIESREAATENFSTNYSGRGLDTLPTEILLEIASYLVDSLTSDDLPSGSQSSAAKPLKRFETVCRFRSLCRVTANTGQTVITKVLSKGGGVDGFRASVDLPSKQSLGELSSVFFNAGFASIVTDIVLHAQPYITDADLWYMIYEDLEYSRHVSSKIEANALTDCVVGEFEAHNDMQQDFAIQLRTATGFQQLRSLVDRLPHIRRMRFQCHDYWHGYDYFSDKERLWCQPRDGEPTHWRFVPHLLRTLSDRKYVSLYLHGDSSLMAGFNSPGYFDLLQNFAASLKSVTLKLTRDELKAAGSLRWDFRARMHDEQSSMLRYARTWERCLAGAHMLEELSVKCSENKRIVPLLYVDETWLNVALFGQRFQHLRRFVLDGCSFEASKLETFMVHHATSLKEVVLEHTTCHNYFEGLAHMIYTMRAQLRLQQCTIRMHQQLYDPQRRLAAPVQTLCDILVKYADIGQMSENEFCVFKLQRVDLGRYVMRKATRGYFTTQAT